MAGKGIVVAFSGAIGTGKSSISSELANRLDWPRISFGDYVRSVAEENGRDSNDRAVLQALGQALVLTNTTGFVQKVLGSRRWDTNLVLDGLRHVEVRQALVTELGHRGVELKLVYVSVDEDTRQERVRSDKRIERRLLSAYDQDLTEAQIPKIVPAYADLKVDGTLPVPTIVDLVISKLGLQEVEFA